jgi:hypothetical protein
MSAQLQAGAEFFTVPFWKDLPDTEANLSSDDPIVNSTPLKVSALQQIVRKSFVILGERPLFRHRAAISTFVSLASGDAYRPSTA